MLPSLPSAILPLSSHLQIFTVALPAAVTHTCTSKQFTSVRQRWVYVDKKIKRQHVKIPFITAVTRLFQEGSSHLCEKALWKLTKNSNKNPLWFILRTEIFHKCSQGSSAWEGGYRKHQHLLKWGEKAFIYIWLYEDEKEQLLRCLKEWSFQTKGALK